MSKPLALPVVVALPGNMVVVSKSAGAHRNKTRWNQDFRKAAAGKT